MPDVFLVAGDPQERRGTGMANYKAALRAVWNSIRAATRGATIRYLESQIGASRTNRAVPIFLGCTPPPPSRVPGRSPMASTRSPPVMASVREVGIFRDAARAAGRDAEALPIIARANATLTDSPLPEADRALFTGTVAQWAADLARLATLGIDHTFFSIDGPIEARRRRWPSCGSGWDERRDAEETETR